ncbi:MAG: hypothetical protein JW852_05660 [Spirochaetales bacterium]|nr:hypothetical protein [Spirochaetales bacterium]
MKRYILLCLIALLPAVTGVFADAAIDYGGALSNRTGITLTDETTLSQGNGLSFWFTAQGVSTGFTFRAGYTFVYDGEADPQVTHLPDIQTLNLYGNYPVSTLGLSRFRFDLGRLRFYDHSRYVIDQNLDGIRFGFFYPKASVQASVGTSMLPNKSSNPLVLSKADVTDLTEESVFMGSPRVVGFLEAVFTDIFKQELTLSAGFQEDLRYLFAPRSQSLVTEGQEVFEPEAGGLVDTQYAGVGVRGNITGGLFYSTFFTLSTGRTLSYLTDTGAVSGAYAYTPIISGAGGASLNLYLPAVMSSAAEVKVLLSTGDGSEARTSFYEDSRTATPALFIPITAKPLSFVLAPSLGNLVTAGASYSLKPLSWLESFTFGDKLQASVNFSSFWKYKNGPVSFSVPNTASEKAYIGTEADIALSFRPFSDLGVSLTGGLFIPNGASGGPYDAVGATGTVTKLELSASFSF